ncbi:MAG: hypothetical protein HFF69_06240 [Oscillospiraceae bacterium]|jgi:hypothetical protein|nr:hypothetical protein [Oscillospiraceae bacterium]
MNLSKDAIKILKIANAQETINFEDGCLELRGSVHVAYAPEVFAFLENHGLVIVHSEMVTEDYKKTTIRITPEGQAELGAYLEKTREKWITRSLSISALIISAVSIIWQILSSTTLK